MARPRSIEPLEYVRVRLDPQTKLKVDLWLNSDVEGRVPYGAYKGFFTLLIQRFFGEKDLDLAPFLGSEPGAYIIRGSSFALAQLIDQFKANSTEIESLKQRLEWSRE